MNRARNIVLYGAGGGGRELADSLSYDPFWNVIGFVDETIKPGTIIDGLEVLGGLDWIRQYNGNLALCILNYPVKKAEIIKRIQEANKSISFPVILNIKSQVSKHAVLGEGCIVAHPFNKISPGVYIGKHVWINTGCRMGHNVKVGDYSTIYSGINIGGETYIGQECLIGSGVTIKPGVMIGDGVTVGAGSVVVKNVPDHATVVGNPARILQK